MWKYLIPHFFSVIWNFEVIVVSYHNCPSFVQSFLPIWSWNRYSHMWYSLERRCWLISSSFGHCWIPSLYIVKKHWKNLLNNLRFLSVSNQNVRSKQFSINELIILLRDRGVTWRLIVKASFCLFPKELWYYLSSWPYL